MTTLHLVRQSAFNTNDFAQCIEIINDNDAIVLLDDGCYNLHHPLINNVINQNVPINVLAQHAVARAISIDESLFLQVSMNDLVSLTCNHDRVITWQ
ncbi:MAG: sulfurtransferase complex subunit TusB [Litorilituus sp.]|jgi:tRNA 2-thiouridine synthesizing protein B|nr:sulfurtransferase complex subunit TusB [Litorilituus sp.]